MILMKIQFFFILFSNDLLKFQKFIKHIQYDLLFHFILGIFSLSLLIPKNYPFHLFPQIKKLK